MRNLSRFSLSFSLSSSFLYSLSLIRIPERHGVQIVFTGLLYIRPIYDRVCGYLDRDDWVCYLVSFALLLLIFVARRNKRNYDVIFLEMGIDICLATSNARDHDRQWSIFLSRNHKLMVEYHTFNLSERELRQLNMVVVMVVISDSDMHYDDEYWKTRKYIRNLTFFHIPVFFLTTLKDNIY